MFEQLLNGTTEGLIWGLLALGFYIAFRLLDFADMTCEGSFVLGGATFALLTFLQHAVRLLYPSRPTWRYSASTTILSTACSRRHDFQASIPAQSQSDEPLRRRWKRCLRTARQRRIRQTSPCRRSVSSSARPPIPTQTLRRGSLMRYRSYTTTRQRAFPPRMYSSMSDSRGHSLSASSAKAGQPPSRS